QQCAPLPRPHVLVPDKAREQQDERGRSVEQRNRNRDGGPFERFEEDVLEQGKTQDAVHREERNGAQWNGEGARSAREADEGGTQEADGRAHTCELQRRIAARVQDLREQTER